MTAEFAGSLAAFRQTGPSGPIEENDRFFANAILIGCLHLFVVLAIPTLLWDSSAVRQPALLVWTAAEAVNAVLAFAAASVVKRGDFARFITIGRVEGIGTGITFGSLPWIGLDLAGSAPEKHVLLIALVAVTAISATTLTRVTTERPVFGKLVVLLAISYTAAFAIQGEWLFAVIGLAWSAAIAGLTWVGHRGVAELLELRQASERTARHDHLTGLLSRSAFFKTLTRHTQDMPTPTTDRQRALVLFDVDGFKAINDSFGHAAGDAVLASIANRLSLFLPGDAAIGRLGGDEFAAVFDAQPSVAAGAIEAALAAVSEPIRLDGRELYVAASAGWTVIKPDRSPAELMAEADAAMYQSKNSHTATSTAFDTALRDELDRSLDLRHRFRAALKQGEIEYWLQPIVRLSDGNMTAVELLARWPQLDKSIVGPLEFTRVAEETGLAVDLDRLALKMASELLIEWADDPILKSVTIKANISPVHLHNNALLQSVTELIPRRLRRRLGLEFVESRLITAAEKNRPQLEELKAMGITLSIDDFGVGYSSLAYLRTLPISEIKIDRSFVTDLDTDRINQGLIRAIVDIANTLGLPTVAEGIETKEEMAEAERLGVIFAQGYLLGRPKRVNSSADVREAIGAATVNYERAVSA